MSVDPIVYRFKSGAGSWEWPVDEDSALVMCQAAGGGGGDGHEPSEQGGTGGGGGGRAWAIVSKTDTELTYSVPSAPSAGVNGGDAYVQQTAVDAVRATGGDAGVSSSAAVVPGGVQGNGTVGTTLVAGGPGQDNGEAAGMFTPAIPATADGTFGGSSAGNNFPGVIGLAGLHRASGAAVAAERSRHLRKARS
jgi:hypothetical protein